MGVEAILDGCRRLGRFDVSQCKNLGGWIEEGGVVRWEGRGVVFEVVAGGNGGVGKRGKGDGGMGMGIWERGVGERRMEDRGIGVRRK